MAAAEKAPRNQKHGLAEETSTTGSSRKQIWRDPRNKETHAPTQHNRSLKSTHSITAPCMWPQYFGQPCLHWLCLLALWQL